MPPKSAKNEENRVEEEVAVVGVSMKGEDAQEKEGIDEMDAADRGAASEKGDLGEECPGSRGTKLPSEQDRNSGALTLE